MTYTTGSKWSRVAAGRGGFTLVELMVVILIIATLMSIMLVVYSQLQKGAKEKLYQTQRRGLQAACKVYKLEYGTWPMPDDDLAKSNPFPATYKDDNNVVVTVMKDATPVPVFKSDDFNYNAAGDVIAKDGIPFRFVFQEEDVTVD